MNDKYHKPALTGNSEGFSDVSTVNLKPIPDAAGYDKEMEADRIIETRTVTGKGYDSGK